MDLLHKSYCMHDPHNCNGLSLVQGESRLKFTTAQNLGMNLLVSFLKYDFYLLLKTTL